MHHKVDNYRQSDWIMVQVPVKSFSSVNIATTGPLEATLGISQVHSLLSVNIATPDSLQVVHRFTPGRYMPGVNQALEDIGL